MLNSLTPKGSCFVFKEHPKSWILTPYFSNVKIQPPQSCQWNAHLIAVEDTVVAIQQCRFVAKQLGSGSIGGGLWWINTSVSKGIISTIMRHFYHLNVGFKGFISATCKTCKRGQIKRGKLEINWMHDASQQCALETQLTDHNRLFKLRWMYNAIDIYNLSNHRLLENSKCRMFLLDSTQKITSWMHQIIHICNL